MCNHVEFIRSHVLMSELTPIGFGHYCNRLYEDEECDLWCPHPNFLGISWGQIDDII